MLVLSRKLGEKLNIGSNIVVAINRIAGNRVTLGIKAPIETRVVRAELDCGNVDDGKSGSGEVEI